MMFEAAEIGKKIDKTSYREQVPKVRAELLELQRQLATSGLSVVILVGGAEGAGKEEIVDLFLEWMDARGVETHAMWDTTDEERERPSFWRFWRVLPPKGKTAILFGSWYSQPIIQRVYGQLDDSKLQRAMHRIVEFERMLNNEGVVIIKFWLHLSKALQKKRLRQFKKDPTRRWRVGAATWKFFKRFDEFRRVSELSVRLTSTGFAPWHIVEATDSRYRNLMVTTTVTQTLTTALARKELNEPPTVVQEEPRTVVGQNVTNLLRRLDLEQRLLDGEYRASLKQYQGQLSQLARALCDSGHSMLLVFEGPDAAGKGGTIRRLTRAIDSRIYRVISVAAPTDEELAHPYLWRFWRNLPRQGRITIYDRSWYGRVLVERIEGFTSEENWSRAYSEINDFETELTEFGIIIIKFWLAISAEEQLRRFQDRSTTPYKQYKLTEEDWRNRAKWDAYEEAACDMIARTSTAQAPWVLVEANDKNWARIKVLKTVCTTLEKRLSAS